MDGQGCGGMREQEGRGSLWHLKEQQQEEQAGHCGVAWTGHLHLAGIPRAGKVFQALLPIFLPGSGLLQARQ